MTPPHKTHDRLTMRLNAAEQSIVAALISEQHEKLRASGALLAAPTMPDIVRSLIAREGERLAKAESFAEVASQVIEQARNAQAWSSEVTRRAIETREEENHSEGGSSLIAGPATVTFHDSVKQNDSAPEHPIPARYRCRSSDDEGDWPVFVPTDEDGVDLAIVNDETIAMFREANSERNRSVVAYYFCALKRGERFLHPLKFVHEQGIQT